MIVKGYKATDKDMKCKGFQFQLGVWYEHHDDVVLYEKGFHFCKYPSGVYSEYVDNGTRLFKIEAEEVLEASDSPGADIVFVCKKIKFIKEVEISSKFNTGKRNAGRYNFGNKNTGNQNTGNMNSGVLNIGDLNTGKKNNGNRNVGDWNTGSRNVGYRNIGHFNTGEQNTGSWNTGSGNIGDSHAGFFCIVPETIKSFDVETGMSKNKYVQKFGNEVYEVQNLISRGITEVSDVEFNRVSTIPGITKEKLETLLKLHKHNRN